MQNAIRDEIVVLLQQNEVNAAVKKIYDYYFEGIVQLIKTNGGNEDDGRDIFQESVLVVIDKVQTGKFRGESSLKTFIYAIARNQWLHRLRTDQRRIKREKDYNYTEIANRQEDVDADLQFDTDLQASVGEIMDQIGEACKKLLTSFYYEKKKMREIMDDFDFENEQVLRNKKSKCMKKIKDYLQSKPMILKTLKSQL